MLDDKLLTIKEPAACCLAHLAAGPKDEVKEAIAAAGAVPELKKLLNIPHPGISKWCAHFSSSTDTY